MSSTIVRTENVSKQYKNVTALTNINLQLNPGRIYGLIGPNGSGKTTLMKIILSFLNHEGKIFIKEKLSFNDSVKINYVPEVISFYEFLSGEQAVSLITDLQGNNLKDMLAQFEYKSTKLGYKDKQKLIKEHSKGNLRKLMLLQAISTPSDLLLLDEPFSGLDPISTEKFKPLLSELREQKTTILLNTHLFDVAKAVCDTLIFIKDGAIIHQADQKDFADIDLVELFEKETQSHDV